MPVAAYPEPIISVIDGIFHLGLTPNSSFGMRQHGAPLSNLGPGWTFFSLYSGFSPIFLFELRHESGARATWFFDRTGKFIGHSIGALAKSHQQTLLRKATALLSDLLAPIFGGSTKTAHEQRRQFFELSGDVRRELLASCGATLIKAPNMIVLSDLPEAMLIQSGGISGRPPALLLRERLAGALSASFQARLFAALHDGYLSWPSPTDGPFAICSGGLLLNDFDQAYRFEDDRSGLVYFLLVTQHVASINAIYVPSENLLVTEDLESQKLALARFSTVSHMFIEYFGKFGLAMGHYLESGPKPLSAFMREHHIGHQLWNELSGLEAITRTVPPGKLPDILTLGPKANQLYGPISRLFPEFSTKLQLECLTTDHAVFEIQERKMIPARFDSNYISENLRRRILSYVRTTPAGLAVENEMLGQRRNTIIVGLRVENRTVADLGDFLCKLVTCISETLPNCHIILDGQNRREDDKPVGSFSDHLAQRSPLDIEQELCSSVIESARDKPVLITSTTGQPVAVSLAWSKAADCCIAIWGAGLAKYRWIGNKPSLIVTSNAQLLHSAELQIYSSRKYMENPTPVVFIDPLAVHDEPGSSALVAIGGQFHSNFHIDNEIFFGQVRSFLAPITPRKARY